jgi:hypothetical protein
MDKLRRPYPWLPEEPEDFALHDGEHKPDPASMLPRMVAACVCGWHPVNHRGFWLADHLRDMNVPGYA